MSDHEEQYSVCTECHRHASLNSSTQHMPRVHSTHMQQACQLYSSHDKKCAVLGMVCCTVQYVASYIPYLSQGFTEAEFLVIIETKMLRVFLLAIHSHLYTVLLDFTPPPSLKKSGLKLVWWQNCLRKPQVWKLSRLCPETSTNLYVHEFGLCTYLFMYVAYNTHNCICVITIIQDLR